MIHIFTFLKHGYLKYVIAIAILFFKGVLQNKCFFQSFQIFGLFSEKVHQGG